MGRDWVTKEVTETETKTISEWVVYCDFCGREASDGDVWFGVKRGFFDSMEDEVPLDDVGVTDPYFRCRDCYENAPAPSEFPGREEPPDVVTKTKTVNGYSGQFVLAMFFAGIFLGGLSLIFILSA